MVAVVPVIAAIAPSELLHVAPEVAEVSTVVLPIHNISVPLIGFGIAFTVTDFPTRQPVGIVYRIVVAPPARAIALPVTESIVITVVEVLLHTPPLIVSVYVVAVPAHTGVLPAIAPGVGFTVTSRVTKQPVAFARYVIVTTPAATPVTTPIVE